MKALELYGINRIQTYTIPEANRDLPLKEAKIILFQIFQEWLKYHNPTNYFPIEELLQMEWSWKDTSNKTLPQRIAYILKQHDIILPKSFYGALGNHVHESIPTSESFIFDFTKTYDWEPGAFDDDGSCLWHGRKKVKTEMEKDPRFSAFRILSTDNVYGGNDDRRYRRSLITLVGKQAYYGVSRCWIFKEKVRIKVSGKFKLGDVYICFNSYGKHPLRQQAALLANMAGVSFRKIKVSNLKKTSGGLYVNGAGYMVGTNSIIENIDHFDIGFQNSYDAKSEQNRIRGIDRRLPSLYFNPFGRKQRKNKNWSEHKRITKKQKNRRDSKQINNQLVREAYYHNRDEMYCVPRYDTWASRDRDTRKKWALWGHRLGKDFYRCIIKMLIYQQRGTINNDNSKNKSKDSSGSQTVNSELSLRRDEGYEPHEYQTGGIIIQSHPVRNEDG